MSKRTISGWLPIRRASAELAATQTATMMVTLAGPDPDAGVSPRPAEAAPAVKVTARCDGNPERVTVRVNTRHLIKVKSVGSIYRPYDFEPIRFNRTLRGHRTMTFESGPGAHGNVLTKQYIFNSDVGSREGARVGTSAGRFVDRCG